MKYNTQNFSKHLVASMKKAGATIDSLSHDIGVSTATLCNWTTNPNSLPTVANLYRLAKVLNTSIDDLVEGAISDEKRKPRHGDMMVATAEKIIQFYNELPAGSLFTISSIVLRTGLTRGQISAAKTNIPAIAQLLSNTRIGRLDYQKPYERYDAPKARKSAKLSAGQSHRSKTV